MAFYQSSYLSRGCRQGDLLSSYTFILCAEILSFKIRNNNIIKGITINNYEHKISQSADDTKLILDGTKTSLDETLNVLSEFAIISG